MKSKANSVDAWMKRENKRWGAEYGFTLFFFFFHPSGTVRCHPSRIEVNEYDTTLRTLRLTQVHYALQSTKMFVRRRGWCRAFRREMGRATRPTLQHYHQWTFCVSNEAINKWKFINVSSISDRIFARRPNGEVSTGMGKWKCETINKINAISS